MPFVSSVLSVVCVYALYTLFIGMEVNRGLKYEDLIIYLIVNFYWWVMETATTVT